MFNDAPEIVIKGITGHGEPFRPGDWAERLSSVFSGLSESGHLEYSPCLEPIFAGGNHCVAVDRALETVNPQGFALLLQFARDNRLRMRPGRRVRRPETPATGGPP